MNIGIVCYPTYGGSGVVATELGMALAKKGHNVHFITYATPTRLDIFQPNVFYHEVSFQNYTLFEHPPYETALASNIVDVVKFQNLEIVHVHYAIPHASAAYIAKQILKEEGIDLKVVTTLHGTDITLVGLEPSFLPLVKLSIEESDGVTAVSRFLKEKTLTNYHIDADIEVIHNFIDTEVYKPVCNEKFRKHIAPNNERILIHTSNFRPVKRVADTIRILEKVKEKIPTKLVLIGDGPDRSKCEKLARELKLEKDVTFLGKQDGLEDLLSVGDIFLMPSQSESFGLSALEAMSCGLPVISSSIGGLPELVLHNKTGYIAEFADIDRMAKYTIELLKNKKKFESFSNNSRNRAVKVFERKLIVPKYIEYYEKILSK